METVQHILIVDDEDALLFSYRKLLRGATIQVDDCMILEEAIAFIRDNNYDVIITDFRLSHSEGKEGLEILKYAKMHKPETPVIVMTGYGSDAIKDEVLALGAYCYLDKPVQISKLITLLRELGVHIGES